jgi:biotin carboxylase
VKQPPFGLVGRDAPPPDAYPLMVKPVTGCGSTGVREVPGPEDYTAILDEGVTEGTMIWESRLDGVQYTVEGIHRGDRFQAIAVTGKRLSGPPHFVVLEHESPAALGPETRARIVTYAERCLDLLGVRDAASHTEIAIGDGDPMIIETHTRPGGDKVSVIAALTTGQDQYELAVAAGWKGGLSPRELPVRGRIARTIHLTDDEGPPAILEDASWLGAFPEVVQHGFARRFAVTDGANRLRPSADPRWGHIVIAGEDRDHLEDVGRRIRARARQA